MSSRNDAKWCSRSCQAYARVTGQRTAVDFKQNRRLTMKTFVLIVTFAATTDLIGGARTERIASFDDYQACASAGRALYSQQRWECVPENEHPKDAPASR